MNYIVLDLEWNQSPAGRNHRNEGIPFEIVQIGAVKLDKQLQRIDTFGQNIQPQVYPTFHSKVAELLDVTMEELKATGKPFPEVISEFLAWCGKDCIFCTWGTLDLTELQKNMQYYQIERPFPMPFLYYDLQKLYSIQYSDGKTRITLQKAIEERKLASDKEYHMALNDAIYTADVMATLDMGQVGRFYSVDTFRIPQTRKEEIYLDFGDYAKYISKGFDTKEKATEYREVRSCKCFLCNKSMKKHIKWFATNGKSYYGLFSCEQHGLIKGRFKARQADNGLYYVTKILKRTDEEGAAKIKRKQEKEREHRKLKAQQAMLAKRTGADLDVSKLKKKYQKH